MRWLFTGDLNGSHAPPSFDNTNDNEPTDGCAKVVNTPPL